MADLGVGQSSTTTIFTDSQSALAVARNPVFHARTKHIEVHYYYVKERFFAGGISLAYVHTQENIADLVYWLYYLIVIKHLWVESSRYLCFYKNTWLYSRN
jgi:hypothetical protein